MRLIGTVDEDLPIRKRALKALAIDGERPLIDIDELAEIVRVRMGLLLVGELEIMDVRDALDRNGYFEIFQYILHRHTPFL